MPVGIMSLMQQRAVWHLVGLGTATAVCIGLVLADAAVNRAFTHAYLIWNLFLAWLPLLFAYGLQRTLQHKLWSSWAALGLTVLWFAFLPNSFYLVSDFVHLGDFEATQLVFGAVMLTALTLTGLWLGVTSLVLVHTQLRRRLSMGVSTAFIGLTLFIASVAIYIGRDLRWNSWDLLLNPFGLLFDLSERFIHPSQYAQVFSVVAPTFILLATVYFLSWRAIRAVEKQPL